MTEIIDDLPLFDFVDSLYSTSDTYERCTDSLKKKYIFEVFRMLAKDVMVHDINVFNNMYCHNIPVLDSIRNMLKGMKKHRHVYWSPKNYIPKSSPITDGRFKFKASDINAFCELNDLDRHAFEYMQTRFPEKLEKDIKEFQKTL